jgi:hypothetical protein
MALVNADSVLEDKIAQLDPSVRAKFRMLEADRNDASDAVDGTQRRWEESRDPLQHARYAASAAQAADRQNIWRRQGGKQPPSPAVEASAARVKQAEELEGARREARDDAVQRFTVAQRLLASVQDLIRRTDVTELPAILLTPRSTPTKPADVAADLTRVRDGIAQVVLERTALDRAPVPLVEASRRLDDLLDGLATQWDPPVGDFTRPAFTPPSPDSLFPYKPIVLLANLAPLRDALHARLKAAYATQPASVPSADRPARAAELANRQRRLEVAEEHAILAAAQAGHVIQRRPDADPLVVLTAVLSA